MQTVDAITVWAEPLFRYRDLKLRKGDGTAAIADFIEQCGHPPAMIRLNPRNEQYAKEAGDIPVEYRGGVSVGEVWRIGSMKALMAVARPLVADSRELPPLEDPQDADETTQIGENGCNTIPEAYGDTPDSDEAIVLQDSDPPKKRGPKHRPLPEDEIWRLRAAGKTVREIAEAIGGMSHMTVARIVAGQRRLPEVNDGHED
jgi:hypothetical protein